MGKKKTGAGLHPEKKKVAGKRAGKRVFARTVFCKLKNKIMAGSKALEVYQSAGVPDKEHICAVQCSHKCFN